MTRFQPLNPDFEARVRDSFQRQPYMRHLGARMMDVRPGYVEIKLPFREEMTQQHGYFHGGAVGSLADNAGGYAAFTLMPATASILTVEYKVNFLAPGRGDYLIAQASVIKPGRTLTISDVQIYGVTEGAEKLCATGLCTLMTMTDLADDPTKSQSKEIYQSEEQQ